MIWQDWLVAAASISMILGLIPSVKGSNKPALKTSFITAFWIFVICGVYVTLGLFLSAVLLFTQGVLWSVLAYQKRPVKGTLHLSSEEFINSLQKRIKIH